MKSTKTRANACFLACHGSFNRTLLTENENLSFSFFPCALAQQNHHALVTQISL
jgi:hypothetical protein